MSRDALSKAVASAYPDKPPGTKGLFVNMIWAFYHEITVGDFVIARRGRTTLAGVGQVTKVAFRAEQRSPVHDHVNFLGVSWQEQPRDKAFPNIVFPMVTLNEFDEQKFRGLLEGLPQPPEPPPGTEDPSEFVLEKHLEDFIVSNFDKIFEGTLSIYEDAEGIEGRQYPTEGGVIDILAIDNRSKAFIVIELKKGRSSDQVVGQVLRYMGWVKQNLCSGGQSVRGLVICRERDSRLSYALEMTTNIDVRYYTMSFKLTS